MLKLKACIGCKRIERKVTKFIETYKDLVNNESRLTTNWKNTRIENRFWQKTWIDEVAIMMQDCKLSLFSDSEIVLTKNKTLIDYGL